MTFATARPSSRHLRSVMISLLLVPMLSACGDNPVASSSMTLTLSGPSQVDATLQGTRLECPYVVTLSAENGGTGEKATLLGMTLEFRDDDTGELFGTPSEIEVTQGQLANDWFGSAEVTNGDSRTASRDTWTVPHTTFRQVHILRYRTSTGDERTATYTFTCV